MYSITRYHDISCGHRVVGHESKCAHLHGHNYRIHFEVKTIPGTGAGLDGVGRIVDFSVIKSTLCQWLEDEWDHKMLLWEQDPLADWLWHNDHRGVYCTPFNPTAENMARFLVETLAPALLEEHGVYLARCTIEETRKCSATFERGWPL
jgi:6-pyruvoyltetrahydropterin/6-carboxytetrahydropterin synthase